MENSLPSSSSATEFGNNWFGSMKDIKWCINFLQYYFHTKTLT